MVKEYREYSNTEERRLSSSEIKKCMSEIQNINNELKEGEIMSQKNLKVMGWIATCTAMLMYISYFPQIINNIHGNKAGFLQPMVAAINCTLWVSYGFFQEKKDWPIIVANIPGVVFGAIAAITAL